jgi:hypothetical protein
MELFTFDPAHYASLFAAQGYVHIREGLTEEYYQALVEQVEDHLRRHRLEQFALGDKQQALYEFPAGSDGYTQVRAAVGGVCGLEAREVVVSERHIKAYDSKADPLPTAHKDRFATQVAVGFAVHVPLGSTLVLWPHDDVGPNPFNSWAELRASLPAEQAPDVVLDGAERVEIHDAPRDVVMFHGSAVWHRRENAAGTTMLYFKLNAWNCDPIGEDPQTPECRTNTKKLLSRSDDDLCRLVPRLGRKVDTFQRRYTRDWQDLLGVALYGDRFLTVDETEWALLHEVDGCRNVAEVIASAGLLGCGCGRVRRLAEAGVLDLVTPERAAPVRNVLPVIMSSHDFPALEQLQLFPRK